MQVSSFKLIVEIEFRIKQFISGNYGVENSQKTLKITKFVKKLIPTDLVLNWYSI